MDCRLDQLTEWVSQQVETRTTPVVLEVVSGDASFRRYFRLRAEDDTKDLIAVDAPPPQEDCKSFVSVARALLEAGVEVPEVFAVDYEQGFMLLSDLGDDLLLDCLSRSDVEALNVEELTVEALYQKALGCLAQIMSCKAPVPSYSGLKLQDEMSLFPDWFLQEYLGVAVEPQVLRPAFDLLAESALEQPQVFVHRDYHSRNLMITPRQTLGVIDFQDAVVGPITYDIVSLLRDCYVAWPLSRVESWVEESRQYLQQKGLVNPSVTQSQFMKWFDLMGAQRHLKAIGIFARLNCRDAKPGYLLDIPRTLRYLLDVCDEYDALSDLAGEIRQRILPALFEKNKQASQWFQKAHYVDIDLNLTG